MNEYLEGTKLYGDDFSFDQIKVWYDEEAEGYANLGSKHKDSYAYGYHTMNKIHGFDKIKASTFNDVMGFGSAWGYEFEPIIDKIVNLTIIEPSDNLVNNTIGHLKPNYVKPTIEGKLPFEDNSFDLITCFGTLHHIPNVSYILTELVRTLKPGGHLMFREPVISMGDWRKPRTGLTKNERGIPVSVFDATLSKCHVEVVSKEYCFMLSSLIQRTLGSLLSKPVYAYKSYVLADKYISKLLKGNLRYHATKKLQRIAPQSVFYVVKKL